MSSAETRFNHVGICVTDMQRSRSFYENALGFDFWWELDPASLPDESTAQLLQLDPPVDLRVVYLLRDEFVLELLTYNPERYAPARRRSMAEPGLTHISLTVDDVNAALERVESLGGTVLRDTHAGAVMVRDPDGQLIELLPPGWRDSRPPMPGSR